LGGHRFASVWHMRDGFKSPFFVSQGEKKKGIMIRDELLNERAAMTENSEMYM